MIRNGLKIVIFILLISGLGYLAYVVGAKFFGNSANINQQIQTDSLQKDVQFENKNANQNQPSPVAVEKKDQVKAYSVLDGLPLNKAEYFLIAVMIENHPDARPQQKGLSRAQVVYEMLAEGGITRFMALYSHDFPESLGPLRSARPYFVEFADQFKSLYLHAGGSDDALKEINRNDRILALNGLVYEGINYFVRDAKLAAPHNLFVKGNDIIKALPVLKWKFDLSKPYFTFAEDFSANAEVFTANKIAIDFSFPEYKVDYVYDGPSHVYERNMAGKPHVDKDAGQKIEPANVGVIFTDYSVYDKDGRLDLRTTGKGDFWLFKDGKLQRGTWIRKAGSVMQFKDLNGVEMSFRPGQIFFEVINQKEKVTFS